MTAPHEPREEGKEASPKPGRTPQLSVVEGDFETLLCKLLRLMTRETTPELKQLLHRLSDRASLRAVDSQSPGSKSDEMPNI